MFIIDKRNNIKLTKGDTATMFVEVKDLLGQNYTIKSTDTVKMTVKTPSGVSKIAKTATPDHYFVITHNDTAAMDAGLYYYDVELSTTEGFYYTIIPTSYFELTSEVS